MSCLFNYNLPPSFSNKTVYNELLVIGYAYCSTVWKNVFLLHIILNKNENIINAARAGYFLKIAKINSQGEKPICPNHKKISYRITQKIAKPQKFRAKRYVDLGKTFKAGRSNAILEEIFLPNKSKFDHVYMIGGVTRRILPHLYGVVHFHVKRP